MHGANPCMLHLYEYRLGDRSGETRSAMICPYRDDHQVPVRIQRAESFVLDTLMRCDRDDLPGDLGDDHLPVER